MLSFNRTINWMVVWVILAIGILWIVVSGCQSAVSGTTEAILIEQATPTPRPSRTPATGIILPSTPTPTPEGAPLTLTFWTVEEVSPLREDEAGDFLRASLRLFERETPNVEVNLLVKKSSGKGGVLDFLRTSKEVAPSVLPDVVIMNATDLEQAQAGNLLQPLDGRLDRSIVQDLLPAARRIGTVKDRLAGVPIGLEMEHTVYNTNVFTETPMLWTDVLTKNSPYLFPAKGVNGLVNDFTLAQYFSEGGELLNDEGLPKIDDNVLINVLKFYETAQQNQIIDQSLLEAGTNEELWPRYLAGQAGIAQISVRQYLTDREGFENTTFAPLPVHDETDIPISIMHAWVLVLITDDVSRQDAALRLIESFLSTANNATWNQINKSIPTRDTAYQQLAGNDPYWAFLTDQLNTARPEPRFPEYDRIGRIIQQTVEQVLRQEATPEDAVATAIDALAQ